MPLIIKRETIKDSTLQSLCSNRHFFAKHDRSRARLIYDIAARVGALTIYELSCGTSTTFKEYLTRGRGVDWKSERGPIYRGAHSSWHAISRGNPCSSGVANDHHEKCRLYKGF
jgi:hypothetical protein